MPPLHPSLSMFDALLERDEFASIYVITTIVRPRILLLLKLYGSALALIFKKKNSVGPPTQSPTSLSLSAKLWNLW